MISSGRQRGAISALHAIAIMLRYDARKGEVSASTLAAQLDSYEYLFGLWLETKDRTEQFGAVLADMASRWPEFALAVQRFNESEEGS